VNFKKKVFRFDINIYAKVRKELVGEVATKTWDQVQEKVFWKVQDKVLEQILQNIKK
jgi:hypothetical protein